MAMQKSVEERERSESLRKAAYAIYYDGGLRDRVIGEHHGRYLVLDVETGDYEIDDNLMEATLRMRERRIHPESVFAFRIGYIAAVRSTGSRVKRAEPE